MSDSEAVGGRPSVIVNVDPELTDEQSAELGKRFEEAMATQPVRVWPPSAHACNRTFGDTEHAGTCPDCAHAVIAHIGTGSCVICRMEYTLTPQWRQHQARILGRDTRRIV